MSTAAHFTFDPYDEGAPRGPFLAWAHEHGVALESGNLLYYFGSGGERIEADYESSHQVTLSTFHMGPGVPALADLALDFWVEFGGSMHADEELRGLIRARYQAYSRTQAGERA
jgi:hypothetical protein